MGILLLSSGVGWGGGVGVVHAEMSRGRRAAKLTLKYAPSPGGAGGSRAEAGAGSWNVLFYQGGCAGPAIAAGRALRSRAPSDARKAAPPR